MKNAGIGFQVIVTSILSTFIAMAIMGWALFRVEVDLRKEKIEENGLVSLAPIESLAKRNINGGNVMNLKSAATKELYGVNPKLLLVIIEGTSEGTPKTDFFDAVPPQVVAHTYANPVTTAPLQATWTTDLNKMKTDLKLDSDRGLLFIRRDLGIKNGGSLLAVFAADEVKTISASVTGKVALISLLVAAIAGVFGFVVSLRISRPMQAAILRVEEISQSLDLSGRLNEVGSKEFVRLAKAFNHLIEKLQDTIEHVSVTTQLLNDSASGLSSTSDNLFAQTESLSQEAQSLSTISATIDTRLTRVTSNAKSTEDDAKNVLASEEAMAAKIDDVSQVSGSASGQARDVSKSMDAVASEIRHVSMRTTVASRLSDELATEVITVQTQLAELSTMAQSIGAISNVIEKISSRTNLLSLNATIEAAHAGGAGRGFSVVAEEVGTLAKRTAEAGRSIATEIRAMQSKTQVVVHEIGAFLTPLHEVKEISDEIEGSVSDQETATHQVADTGHTMLAKLESVVNSASESADYCRVVSERASAMVVSIAEISQDTQETATDVGQLKLIGSRISRVTGVTNRNAEGVRRNAMELREISDKLVHVVSRFRT